MKTLGELIKMYTNYLQQGEIQIAYKGILGFIGRVRAEFIKTYPEVDVSSIYGGYMDMSYFSLSTKPLRDQGLKIAIVYLHEKGDFEVWLSARNREIAKSISAVISGSVSNASVFHDIDNPDAIIEHILTPAPDFDDQDALICEIMQGTENFIQMLSPILYSLK